MCQYPTPVSSIEDSFPHNEHIQRVFTAAGCQTLLEVAAYSRHTWFKIPGFGGKNAGELREALAEAGLKHGDASLPPEVLEAITRAVTCGAPTKQGFCRVVRLKDGRCGRHRVQEVPSNPYVLPHCCTPSDSASLAERLYCAYNRGGDPETAGLNYQGKPCPLWLELPANIQEKWEAAAGHASPDGATLRELLNTPLRLSGSIKAPQSFWCEPFDGRVTNILTERGYDSRGCPLRYRGRPIQHIGDLVKYTADNLLCRSGFGRKCLAEVEDWLSTRGLRLGMSNRDTKDWSPPA